MGGEVFFAAERSAGGGLDDGEIVVRLVESVCERFKDVERALQRAFDDEAAGFRVVVGEHALGFEIDMFLQAGLVGGFDDVRGGSEDRAGVAFADVEVFEDVVGFVLDEVGCGSNARIEQERQGGVVDADGADGFFQEFRVFVGQQENGFVFVAEFFAGQDGLFVFDKLEFVAGDILGGDDGEFIPIDRGIEVDMRDSAARGGGTDGGAVEQAFDAEVIDVACGAAEFSQAVDAGDVVCEGGHCGKKAVVGLKTRDGEEYPAEMGRAKINRRWKPRIVIFLRRRPRRVHMDLPQTLIHCNSRCRR